MNIQTVRQYCLAKPLATEDSAFGPEGVLFRVYNKIFAYIDLEKPYLVVLKADPDYAIELRDQYRGIQGAFHWNKKYWNEVHFDTDVPDDLILQLIDHSLSEVLRKLPKKDASRVCSPSSLTSPRAGQPSTCPKLTPP